MFVIMICLLIVNCYDPSPVAGVTFSPFSDTSEGANISFNCEPGLEPQMEDVSECSSNGSWVPNPVHRICSTLTRNHDRYFWEESILTL